MEGVKCYAKAENEENLMIAAKENYEKLNTLIFKMSDEELNTPFDFSKGRKRKKRIGKKR